MTEKGEEMGGMEGEREREHAELWKTIHEKKKQNKIVLDLTLEKEEGFQFQTLQLYMRVSYFLDFNIPVTMPGHLKTTWKREFRKRQK